MTDVVTRLRRWVISTDAVPASDLMDEAADEIVSLRSLLQRQSESACTAVSLMGRYAERYGFLLGGLDMVQAGHTTADRVLAAAEEKYGEAE